MTTHFDTRIIGTGTAAGYTAAYRLVEAGQRVAVVDCQPYGGTCFSTLAGIPFSTPAPCAFLTP